MDKNKIQKRGKAKGIKHTLGKIENLRPSFLHSFLPSFLLPSLSSFEYNSKVEEKRRGNTVRAKQLPYTVQTGRCINVT